MYSGNLNSLAWFISRRFLKCVAYIESNVSVTVNTKFGSTWKEVIVANFKKIPKQYPRDTEEVHEEPQSQ
jgi:hypothetical protein